MPLYHRDVYMPAGLAQPITGTALRYAIHAYHEATKDRVEHQLPTVLLPCVVVETETLYPGDIHKVLKWVVRVPLDDHRDLVLVLKDTSKLDGTYFVKTVWVSHRDDTHGALRADRYEQPPCATEQTLMVAMGDLVGIH